ncbi:AMP-binding protein [Aureitalea marina]|uniref:AMP-dependent synthetase/ligase domain-containing protein n=1 Tax=Aureitalea marina TaxID=930804 RepID=A0A2S7KNB7_9FLAO|nr:AMP-binding protein [Aureitalea marina]PQB04080.1 hypothetical protein BST85_03575 [Aureitalea marina]
MSDFKFILHPDFKLNGLTFSSTEELLHFADDLQNQGEAYEYSVGSFLEQWVDFEPWIEVSTSGSTGIPKRIKLEKSRMINSAEATGAYFKLGPGTTALLCLSADFIAGKMMLVRAMVLGWDLHVVAPEKDALTQYDNAYDFVAMVPYQLDYSIDALSKVRKLIVGGSPVSQQLLDKIQDAQTEIFATYGMTETITHVAVRRLNGFARSDIYTALPGVQFEADDEGQLIIHAPKISEEVIRTNDQVDLVSPTSFKWLGRTDSVINSGGVKIYPEWVEQKLSRFLNNRLIVTSEPDAALGERLILVIESQSTELPGLEEALNSLGKFERPKKIYTLSHFPMTPTDKIRRSDIRQLIHHYGLR